MVLNSSFLKCKCKISINNAIIFEVEGKVLENKITAEIRISKINKSLLFAPFLKFFRYLAFHLPWPETMTSLGP
jgi:hypothetical protein